MVRWCHLCLSLAEYLIHFLPPHPWRWNTPQLPFLRVSSRVYCPGPLLHLPIGNNRFSSPVCQMRNPAASPASPSSNQSSWHACSVHLSFNSSLLHKFDTQQNMLSRRSTLRGHPAKSPFPSQKQIHRELTECTS